MTLRPLYDLKAIQEQQTYKEITTRVRAVQGPFFADFAEAFFRKMLLLALNHFPELLGRLLAIDDPWDAELVNEHTETKRPKCFLERHLNHSIFC